MPTCVVKCCKNYSSKLKKSQGITFHAFPRNKKRRNDWMLIIRNCRGDNNWNPSSASVVCSDHFYDIDFITTVKGLRCLVPYAIPKKLLSNSPETQTQSTFSPILQMSPNVEESANDQQPISSSTPLTQVPVLTDEFKLIGYCRLCANLKCDGMLVNVHVDDIMKQLIVNMSNRLNTNIDFSQEHLPTTICSVCLKSLYTSYDFIVGIDLAQMTLNKISMQKYNPVKSNNDNVDLENTSLLQKNKGSDACDLDQPSLHVSSETTSSPQLSPKNEAAPQTPSVQLSPKIPIFLDTTRIHVLKDNLHKKKQRIERQKKSLKRLNQQVRRLKKRNESLKNIIKNLISRDNGD